VVPKPTSDYRRSSTGRGFRRKPAWYGVVASTNQAANQRRTGRASRQSPGVSRAVGRRTVPSPRLTPHGKAADTAAQHRIPRPVAPVKAIERSPYSTNCDLAARSEVRPAALSALQAAQRRHFELGDRRSCSSISTASRGFLAKHSRTCSGSETKSVSTIHSSGLDGTPQHFWSCRSSCARVFFTRHENIERLVWGRCF
jgi:hypothetical protein